MSGCSVLRSFLPGQNVIPGTVSVPRADQCCNNIWFPVFHRVPFAFSETALCGKRTILSGGCRPFFSGDVSSRFFQGGFFISDAVLFRFGDNLQADRAVAVKGAQCLKDGRGKEIPVQKKQAIPERLSGPVSISNHDMEGPFLIDGEIIFHNGELAETDGIQRSRGGPEKVDQGRGSSQGREPGHG